ncbi:amidohydrolase family protein [Ihubacter sp. rT4E-8]|uniref:metal-dependent hydrolase family protein n=1 Tax=Ihubacter sp. rT4E-8 TaxID=3242369 RepID=UPI003CFA4B12
MRRAFIHANVIDVLHKRILENYSVIVEDGKIAEVSENPDLSAVTDVIDLDGKYLSPGLFNCHVHVGMEPVANPADFAHESIVTYTLTGVKHLEDFINTGVTFVRDVGTKHKVAIELMHAVEDGKIKKAPDMQAAGDGICMTGGTGWTFISVEADGVDGLRKAARQQLKNGANVLKLMATGGVLTKGTEPGAVQLSVEEMKAAVDEFHKVGYSTCCHAESAQGVKNAILAGSDCIEHGDELDDEAIEMMLERNIPLDGTVSTIFFFLENKDKLEEEFVIKSEESKRKVRKSFKKAYQAGILCGLGTDCGCSFCNHTDTAYEMVVLVEECEITPFDAMIIGTINSAKICGVEDTLGSVTVGKKAHFAVFEEDPTKDIRASLNCVMTVKNGEILYKKAQ